jgi:hypothetical protein
MTWILIIPDVPPGKETLLVALFIFSAVFTGVCLDLLWHKKWAWWAGCLFFGLLTTSSVGGAIFGWLSLATGTYEEAHGLGTLGVILSSFLLSLTSFYFGLPFILLVRKSMRATL